MNHQLICRRALLTATATLLVVAAASSGWALRSRGAGLVGGLRRFIGGRAPRSLDHVRGRLSAEGLLMPLADPRIVVSKADRTLDLFDGERRVRRYEVALGSTPYGPKRQSGDGRTPEGNYHLCTRVNPSQFHLFMGISYPNAADASRAEQPLHAQLVEAITRAEREGTAPPWNSSLGGAIGLHGGGTSSDWTAGCVALSDEAIEELWLLTSMGTPVAVHP